MHKFKARILQVILFPLLVGMFFSVSSHAQNFPRKPIVLVVPFGAGGSGDLIARTFAQYLEASAKQTIIVDNKPGADGIVGTEFVKNAAPDGYTLLLTTNTTMAANSVFYKKIPYDPLRDFDHIGLFGQAASVALVPKDSPLNTIADLVAASKATPDKFFYGHYNSASRMTVEMLKTRTGAKLTGIPYKAISGALQDFYGAQTQVLFVEYPPAKAQLAGGKVKALGVTGSTRFREWPTIPAINETYPGYELGFYLGLAAPAGLPADVLQFLTSQLEAALKDPAFIAKVNNLELDPGKLNREQYLKFVRAEKDRWAKIVPEAGIQPE
ncbi:MAG: tripartite tricarboxylate transporter substrate binding protein [Betaproteobacteria bacterium]|jgi:tripartite-type tricarboxylate transporter receptor subunit TctC